MANQMWFGTLNHLQWVPCPTIDSTVTRKRYLERNQFQNGGGNVRRSNAYQMEYQLNINGPAHEYEGVDVFNKYASGFYGDGYIYMAHPAAYETNLFAANWASPALVGEGWNDIYNGQGTVSAVTSSSLRPTKQVTWDVTTPADVPVKKFTIVIPPTHTLYLGASGSKTGSAVVRVDSLNSAGTVTNSVDLNLLNVNDSAQMNTWFNGFSHSVVQVYITRTSAAASTISLTSLMARLYRTGTTVDLNGDHYQGEGSTGLAFADDAIVETYSYMYPPRKGISTTLVEVEAWR